VKREPLGLFEGFGIELEYMIVDRTSLAVQPIADRLLAAASEARSEAEPSEARAPAQTGEARSEAEPGEAPDGRLLAGLPPAQTGEARSEAEPGQGPPSEIERGALAWSNELALHLIELKTNGPASRLAGVATAFQAGVAEANGYLRPLGARLMPTGMHPWMDPAAELVLWPHEHRRVYAAFDRIFGCREHGWANVQSVHLNLPFAGDDEFGRLHAAIRVLLPILPALAASSPFVGGRATGVLDNRLEHYRRHVRRIPSLGGGVIPEPIFDRSGYEERILGRIRADLVAHDPEGEMRSEWMNARGAIARFDRATIEIRLLDVQECPAADLAIAGAVVGVLRAFVTGSLASEAAQREFPHEPLAALLRETSAGGDDALVRSPSYLALLGWKGRAPCRAGDLWRELVERTRCEGEAADASGALEVILDEGCLARRILRRVGPQPDRERLREVYEELCCCLAEGRMLRAGR
jgi:gamma-glutamyl:cysteine ligase YbdK (ATP-grasp superfamily)